MGRLRKMDGVKSIVIMGRNSPRSSNYYYGQDVGVKETYSTIQECICHVDPILMDEICIKADCREDVWFFNNYIFDDTYMGRWIMYSELNNEKYYG